MSKKEKTLKGIKTPSRRKFFKVAAATGAAAETPNVSSICFTSSEASKSERDFNDSRISSVFADIFLIDN